MRSQIMVSAWLLVCMVRAVKLLNTGFDTPDYIMGLYECVRSRTPTDCYGVDADSAKSLRGFVVESQDRKPVNGASVGRIRIKFNATSLSDGLKIDDEVLLAKVRIYKQAISEDDILSLKAAGCITSAITVQLFSDEGGASAQANATLTRDDLRAAKWITFGDVADVYRLWAKDPRVGLRSFSLGTAQPSCDVTKLGFASLDRFEPLVVVFVKNSRQSIDFLTQMMAENALTVTPVEPAVRSSRQANEHSSCQLHTFQVSITEDLRWNQFIHPSTYEANFCAGTCEIPIGTTNTMYTTLHAQLQYHLNKRYPKAVPAPCCVPKEYAGVSFVTVKADGMYTIQTMQNLSAQTCHCR